jgi:hypothetical protein
VQRAYHFIVDDPCRDAVKAVAKALLDRQRLTRQEVVDLITPHIAIRTIREAEAATGEEVQT